MKRRTFIRNSSLVAATMMMPELVLAGTSKQKARIGFIGTGLRGRVHLRNLLLSEDVIVPAICDIDPDALGKAMKMLSDDGQKNITSYGDDKYAYLEMLEKEELDGVIIATPWLWHTKMAVAAMKAGVYAGIEVSAANTIEECWDLVNTYESTGTPVMILENVCYRRDVMAVLQMVREGLFGEMFTPRMVLVRLQQCLILTGVTGLLHWFQLPQKQGDCIIT